MNNIPVSDVLEFFYSIFSKLFSFITANSIVKWFVFIPIAAAFLCAIFYFVFDVSHVLDNYNAKNTFLYKGMKNYDKHMAEKRKQEERERKELEKKEAESIRKAYKEYENELKRQYQEAHPYVRTVTKYQDEKGAWREKVSYRKRDDKQPMEYGKLSQTFYSSVDTDSASFKVFAFDVEDED